MTGLIASLIVALGTLGVLTLVLSPARRPFVDPGDESEHTDSVDDGAGL